VKNVAASRPLALYLVLVFVGFWGCLALGYVDRLRFWVPILGALAPVSAALIVTGLGQGEPAARDLMRRLFSWRVRPAWYLAAIGIPVVQNVCAVGLAAIHGAFALSRVPPVVPVLPSLWLVFLFAAGEELGWRGYLLPRLLATLGPVSASVVVGTIHAVWHWPLVVLPHQYLSGVPLVAFSVFVVSDALLFTWIFQNTGGSVLLAVLLHGSSNGAMLFYGGIDPGLAPWLKASISALTAVILVLACGPTLGGGRITTRCT
jgi:uncharacterized protein